MDIIVNCGGNIHTLTQKEKETAKRALLMARQSFEDAAKLYRWLATDAYPSKGTHLTQLAEKCDSDAADADEMVAYFE